MRNDQIRARGAPVTKSRDDAPESAVRRFSAEDFKGRDKAMSNLPFPRMLFRVCQVQKEVVTLPPNMYLSSICIQTFKLKLFITISLRKLIFCSLFTAKSKLNWISECILFPSPNFVRRF